MATSSTQIRLFYKVTDRDGRPAHAYQKSGFSLPCVPTDSYQRRAPGEWHTVFGQVKMCLNGFHVVQKPVAVTKWLGGSIEGRRLFVAEIRGPVIESGRGRSKKYCGRHMRLVKEVIRGTPEWHKALKGTTAEWWI